MAEQQYDYYHQQKNTSSTSKIIAISTLVPFGASLLILAFLTLTLTVIALAMATPLLVFFTPVLLPAALLIGFSVAGFLTSGACGITSLSSFAWMAIYLRRSQLPENLQFVKDRAQETLGDLAQRTKEAAESGISKAQEMAQSTTQEVGKTQEGNRTSS